MGAHSSAALPGKLSRLINEFLPGLGYAEGALTPRSSLWVLSKNREGDTRGARHPLRKDQCCKIVLFTKLEKKMERN